MDGDAASSGDREYGRLYPVARAVMSPAFRFLWRIHVTGLEHDTHTALPETTLEQVTGI